MVGEKSSEFNNLRSLMKTRSYHTNYLQTAAPLILGFVWDKVQSKYDHRSSYIEPFGIVFIVILDQDNFTYSKTLSTIKIV